MNMSFEEFKANIQRHAEHRRSLKVLRKGWFKQRQEEGKENAEQKEEDY